MVEVAILGVALGVCLTLGAICLFFAFTSWGVYRR